MKDLLQNLFYQKVKKEYRPSFRRYSKSSFQALKNMKEVFWFHSYYL
jgi:hypothetical protein